MAEAPAGGAGTANPQALIAKHAAQTGAGGDADAAVIARVEDAIKHSPMGWLQSMLGEADARGTAERGAVQGKLDESKDLVAKNQQTAPKEAGAPPAQGPAAHPAVPNASGASHTDAGPAHANAASGGAPAAQPAAISSAPAKTSHGAAAAAPAAAPAPTIASAVASAGGNDAALDGILNAYQPKAQEGTQMLGRIKQMGDIAQGFNGQLDTYVAQGGSVEHGIAAAANALGSGKDVSAVWANNPYRKVHGILGGIMTGLSAVKSVCNVVGNICGKLGIVLTVIGLLGMIFPPIGVAVSGIARILNVIGLICTAVSFALSGVLTGLNGVVLAQQIASGASAEEKAATADLMMSEANETAGGFINLAMVFGPKFMKGLLGSSKGVVGALISRARSTIGRVAIKATADVKLMASKLVRKLGFGGAAFERVGGAWKDTGFVARTKEAIGESRVGKAFNSAPAHIEQMQQKLMAKYGNTAFAKGLDRVGAWSGATASKFDIEDKVGKWGEKSGAALGNAGANTAFGKRMASAAEQSERETRELAMKTSAASAAHLEETQWKNALDRRAAKNPDGLRNPEVEQKFVANQGQKVRTGAQNDFDTAEKLRPQTERAEQMRTDRFERKSGEYYDNKTNGFTGTKARDAEMASVHNTRAKRYELEGTLGAQDTERKTLLAQTTRSADDEAKLAALNTQLKPLDEARRVNDMYEKELKGIAGGTPNPHAPEINNWKDAGSNVWEAAAPALELAGLKNQESGWALAEKADLKKQVKYDKGKAAANAAGRGGGGTFGDIATQARQNEMADFAAFVQSSPRAASISGNVRSMLTGITSKPATPAAKPAAPAASQAAPQVSAQQGPGGGHHGGGGGGGGGAAPAPTAAPRPNAMIVTPQIAAQPVVAGAPGGGGDDPHAQAATAAQSAAQGPANQNQQDPAAGGAEALPYWPAMLPEFDQATSSFGWMRKVAVEFKKAQITGKQQAVDTLAVYGRYQEYAKLRAAAAAKHQQGAQQTAAGAQQNVTHAGASEQHAGQGADSQNQAKGASQDKAATALPEPESRGFWGRILGAVKRWAKDKAAQVFGWIQEKIASVVLKGLCGVSMGDMRDYAGALKNQQAKAHGVANQAGSTSGQVASRSIKLGSDATKEAQSAADAIGQCDQNIMDVDNFMSDVTQFEGQLAAEKAHAQAFIAQLHAEVHQQQEAQKAAAAQKAAQERAEQARSAQLGGGAQQPAADPNAAAAGPAPDPTPDPVAAPAAEHQTPEQQEDNHDVAEIHTASHYVGAQSDSLAGQLESRAEDYQNQLAMALTNHTGKDQAGEDLKGPAKKGSKTIVDEFKSYATHTKKDMDGFQAMSIDPSQTKRIADAIIQSAEHLDQNYGHSEQALDELFERTYKGIASGRRTLKSQLLDGDNAVGRANATGNAASSGAIDTALPAMTGGWNAVSAPIQAAPVPAAAAGAPVQRKLAPATGGADGGAGSPGAIATQGLGTGAPLPFAAQIQRSFGRHDISGVRAHTGSGADASAKALGARAYATGDNIAFAGGSPDLHTAAHEAAHVVQQRQGVQLKGGIDGGKGDPYEQHADAVAEAVVAGKSAAGLLDAGPGGGGGDKSGVQRDAVDADPAKAAPATANAALVTGAVATSVADRPQVIVDDNMTPEGSQIRKGEFVGRLEPAMRAVASEELGLLRSIAACPYITYYVAMYKDRPAREIEQLIRRFSGSSAKDNQQLQADLLQRIRVGVRQWKETGKLPADLVAADPAAAAAAQRTEATNNGKAAPAGGAVQRKADDSPLGMGEGAPLDGATASRMGGAFGTSFGDVRVHDDETGAASAKDHGAKAYAAGNHVAFAQGQYQPGTPHGDALLAHELTHVVQQRGTQTAGDPSVKPTGGAQSDVAEHDANRGAAVAVQRLHGDPAQVAGHDAMPEVSAGYSLQRCEGDDADALKAFQIHTGTHTWNGDQFSITVEAEPGNAKLNGGIQPLNLTFHAEYTGGDDQIGKTADLLFPVVVAKPGKTPKATFDNADGFATLTVDLFGDGTSINKITHRVDLVGGWTPKSRVHHFQGFAGGNEIPNSDRQVTVKTKDAVHQADANAPTQTGPDASKDNPGDHKAVRVDVAANTAKHLLDELINEPKNQLDANSAPWGALKGKVDADAAKYGQGGSAQADNADEATRLTRLGDTLQKTRPAFIAFGAASSPDAYLPDIAQECIAEVKKVKAQYVTAVGTSWDQDPAGALTACDAAFQQLWYRVTALYLADGKGASAQLAQARSTAGSVMVMSHRAGTATPKLQAALGLFRQAGNTRPDNISQTEKKMQEVRAQFIAGQTGALKAAQKIVEDTQVLTGMAGVLAMAEQFRDLKEEMKGVMWAVANGVGRDLGKVADGYVQQFDKMAMDVEGQLPGTPNPELTTVGRPTVNAFVALVNGQTFKDDFQAIQDRSKHIQVIKGVLTVLAIVGAAALTGGAAGAAVGGALEGAGASAFVAGAGEFTAEVVTFTVMSKTGNQIAGIEQDNSAKGWGKELVTNALMMGALKTAAAGYGRVIKAFDVNPQALTGAGKAAYTAGGAAVGFAALNGFAEVQFRAQQGHWMNGDERVKSVLNNAAMFAAMSLMGFLSKPLNQRIRGSYLLGTAQGRIPALEGSFAGLKAQVDALQGDPKAAEKVGPLLKQIETLWNDDLKNLSDIANGDKTNPGKAAEDFKATVDNYRAQLAMLDLKLAQSGVDTNLGGGDQKTGASLFAPVRPGYVSFKGAQGLEVLKAYYQQEGGTLAQRADGVWEGKTPAGEEMFYVPDDKTAEIFKDGTPKAPSGRTAETIRKGEPGKIRDASQLNDSDVAFAMNEQLQNVKPGEIDAMIDKLPQDQQAKFREVLARASGFGQMDSLNALRKAVEAHLGGGKLYTPGTGSLADNLAYTASKDSFKGQAGVAGNGSLKGKTTNAIASGSIVILDDVVLAKIKSDPAFAASLKANNVVMLQPRGFVDGMNMFNVKDAGEVNVRAQKIMERANAIQAANAAQKMTFDTALDQALDESAKTALAQAGVTISMEVVDPANRSANPATDAIAKQLNGDAGITPDQIKQILQSLPEQDRAMIREMIAQTSEVYSPRRIAEVMAQQQQKILGLAAQKGVAPGDIYYYIALGEKSYGMMAMAHRNATGVDIGHYINGPADLSGRMARGQLGASTMIVILDDVAGSGESLLTAMSNASGTAYQGQIVVDPMVSTKAAQTVFNGDGTAANPGAVNGQPNTTYLPANVMSDIKSTELYKNMTPQQQAQLEKLMGSIGYGGNGLSMAFPYMAPDNNNRLFGTVVAPHFIMNNNAAASKSAAPGWTPSASGMGPDVTFPPGSGGTTH